MKNDEFTQLTLWTEEELPPVGVSPTNGNPDRVHEVWDKQEDDRASYTQLTLEGLWA